MDETIKLEVLFDENLERENQKFFFHYVWKKHFTQLKKSLFFGLLILIIGFIPLKGFDESPIPYIFRYIGFLYLGYVYLLINQYIKSKKQNDQLIENLISDFKQKSEIHNLIFLNKEDITVQTPFSTIGSIWDRTNYRIVEKYLILEISNNLNFIFTKAEFKESNYETLLDFLQQYSKKGN
ncbi:hypothetical protein C1637_11225 [Chryseobacterium lactis]|uniref:YcxB family protein n=1 Tax=Chryseobacterium lactis TaxID=1241981 RepID=A0A3G6RLR0_CHRLC|nr:hypothetical protein [Chryseobacterium lactis]AZA80890.1 hypothetical protein EG342_02715 [Chryseobacterium lactis]AZB05891.1 hypothetical protein EG341_18840 [Chryseobacterium lactis]PNW13389.1 hypothetical protein C1637_11225 [Chryseobacterium lactis]